MAFAHLHVHNEYSYLDGFGSSDTYAARAKELGMEALALTNHGNVDGNIKFQQSCEREGISPIHGFEGYMVYDMADKPKFENRFHITLLAKNLFGWQNLLQLLTKAWIDGYHKRPRFDIDCLEEHLEGVVVMTACSGSFLSMDGAEEIFKRIYDACDGAVFAEVMPHIFKPQYSANDLAIKYAKKYGLKIVATNDCHYILEEDEKAQETLLALQSNTKWKDPKRWKFDFGGLYLRSRREMAREFAKQGKLKRREYEEYIENTQYVVDVCKDFRIPKLEVELPKVAGYEEVPTEQLLRELCEKGFQERLVNKGVKVI